MNVHKSKIDWCTHTWNPVTGCLHGCEYCYARRMISRFKPHGTERPMTDPDSKATGILVEQESKGCFVTTNPVKLVDETGEYVRSTPYPKGFSPTIHMYTLTYPSQRLIPSRIFVSSMGDLFGEWVPDKWITAVFERCKLAPQHTYLFLTKNPKRYTELCEKGLLPTDQNMYYGTTITEQEQEYFWSTAHNCFVSIEPLLGPFDKEGAFFGIKWVIIGAQTGPGSDKHKPKRQWIEHIVEGAHKDEIPVFMKNNLSSAWEAELLREHPADIVWPDKT